MSSSAIETSEPRGRPTPPSVIERSVDLGTVSWAAVVWVVALAVAIALRISGLSFWALSPDEASRAYDAWLLYQGRPSLPGQDLPETAPLFLLLQSVSFFLFGTSDVTARLVPALVGLAILGLIFLLRPVVGRAGTVGMVVLAAFSPTLVNASRRADPEILVAMMSLLVVAAIVRAGHTGDPAHSVRRAAVLGGIAFGALLASGPSSISVVISIAVGVGLAAAADAGGPMRRGLKAILGTPNALLAGIAAFLATLITLFTRLFSDPDAIAGIGETISDWGTLLAESSGATPTQFYLLALLLYEPLAVVLALVATLRRRVSIGSGLGWVFFGGWFVAALVLWSFTSGRGPEHAVHIALPLVLLAGGVLGEALATIDRRDFLRGPSGALALALFGLIIGLIATGILVSRIDTAPEQRAAALQAAVVAMLVVVPLGYAAFVLISADRSVGRGRQPALIALFVPALLLALFTFRSSILLNFYRGDDGNELLAQRTTAGAVRPAVDRLDRLSRDVSVTQGSVRDPAGQSGLSIALDGSIRWPFQWYFRDYPDLRITDPGQALLTDTQVVIAPDAVGMPEAGYTPRDYAFLNRVPPAYADLGTAGVLSDLVSPDRWRDGSRFLLYRDGLTTAGPETVAIGLNGELAARVFPATGPYNLGERTGAGSARGQFTDPIGIAIDANDTIYVVDQGNARVERFDANGVFLGIWGGEETGISFARTPNGFGPTGIAVGPDDLVYVADTWNHRIVVIGSDGALIREIGGEPDAAGARAAADTTDDPALVDTETGLFFGPRDVAVTDEEIFVVDTGNERIQVFSIDGTFKRVWGGYGSEPGQLIEPGGIAIGPNGMIYVADAGNARISVFTPAGEPVARWPVAAWPAPDPAGGRPGFQPYLAFGPDGTLYATSADTGSIEVLQRDGALLRTIRDVDGTALQRPVGIAVAATGDLLIADVARDTVYRYVSPAGDPAASEGDQPPAPGAAPTSGTFPDPPE